MRVNGGARNFPRSENSRIVEVGLPSSVRKQPGQHGCSLTACSRARLYLLSVCKIYTPPPPPPLYRHNVFSCVRRETRRRTTLSLLRPSPSSYVCLFIGAFSEIPRYASNGLDARERPLTHTRGQACTVTRSPLYFFLPSCIPILAVHPVASWIPKCCRPIRFPHVAYIDTIQSFFPIFNVLSIFLTFFFIFRNHSPASFPHFPNLIFGEYSRHHHCFGKIANHPCPLLSLLFLLPFFTT